MSPRVVLFALIAAALVVGVPASFRPHIKKRLDMPGTTSCTTCTLVLQATWAYLHMNGSYERIYEIMNGSCVHFPAKMQGQCHAIATGMKTYLPTLVEKLGDANYTAEMACGWAGFCRIPCCKGPNPEQVHISFTNFPGEMTFSWVTAESDDSVVQYGTSQDSLTSSVTGGLRDPGVEGGWDGFIHYATATQLQPGQRYFYRVGSTRTNRWSQTFFFVMPRSQVDTTSPTRFAVIGDMGADPQAVNTMALLSKWAQNNQIDSILHVGDISYADGNEEVWDIFMNQVQGFAAYVPYMTVPGNHEIAVQYYLKLQAYKNRFFMPMNNSAGRGDKEQQDLFWSADFGLIHIVAIDSESPMDIPMISPDQLRWIEEDLIKAAQNRKNVPWIIVILHRPLYCSTPSRSCQKEGPLLASLMEEMFYKYQVDIVIQAHVHNYQRSLPLYKGQAEPSYNNPRNPVYILNGAGGNREGTNGLGAPNANWPFGISQWGAGTLTAYNSTTLQWQYYLANEATVKDVFILTKQH